MIDMDYEQKYNDALERAKMILCNISEGERCSDIETIFPELRESEDERIRKELVNFLQSPFIKENLTDEKVAPWVAYLEKQKEQKPKDVEEKYLDGIKRDWFERGKKEVLTVPELYGLKKQNEQSLGDFINDFPYSDQKEQKPAEWSEEEYGRLFDIEHYLDGTLQLSPDRKIACIVFLKSLRPHWKPSEVCYGAKGDPDPAGVWKPSEELYYVIRTPQETEKGVWKPSEEQMKALLWCTAHLGGADRRVLAELYEHLKKLM